MRHTAQWSRNSGQGGHAPHLIMPPPHTHTHTFQSGVVQLHMCMRYICFLIGGMFLVEVRRQLRRPGADPGTTAQARGGSRNFWRGDPGCPKRQPVGIFKWQGKKLWGGLNLNPLPPMDPAGHLLTHTVLAYRLRCNPVTIIWVYWPHTDQGRLTL